MVYFLEENHEYFNDKQEQLTSISGLVKKYINNFEDDINIPIIKAFRVYAEVTYQFAKKKYKWWDKENILKYMIENHPDIYKEKIIPLSESFKQNWKDIGEEASEYGTMVHHDEELMAESSKYIKNPVDGMKYLVIPRANGPGYDNSYILDEVLKRRENVCMLEGLVADEKNLLGGQEDRIYLKHMGAGYFHAMNYDFKTDKKLNEKSMWIKNSHEKMKGVLNYFMTTNLHQYTVKMSCYGVLLEKTGKVKVTHSIIDHIPIKGERRYVHLPYYKNYAEYIINNHNTKKSLSENFPTLN